MVTALGSIQTPGAMVGLPPSPDREAMWAHEIPRDVATEVYGVVESVLVDEVRPAIEYLEAASRVAAEELLQRFEDERRGRR